MQDYLNNKIMTVVNSKEFLSNSEPRKAWAKAAKEFVESGNEEPFFPDFFEDEDLSWWQWEQK